MCCSGRRANHLPSDHKTLGQPGHARSMTASTVVSAWFGGGHTVTNPPQNLDPADQNELHRPITGPGCAERTPGRSLSHLSQNARSPRTFRGVKEHSPTFIGLTFFTQPVFPILKLRRRLKLRQKSQFETAEFTAFSSWTFLAL